MIRLYLKEWREYRSLTQQQTAERTGMSPVLISRLETTDQGWTRDQLEKLALGLDIDDPRKLLFEPS